VSELSTQRRKAKLLIITRLQPGDYDSISQNRFNGFVAAGKPLKRLFHNRYRQHKA
jgi:hypothetical protein